MTIEAQKLLNDFANKHCYHLVAKNVQDVVIKPEEYGVWKFNRKSDLQRFIKDQNLTPADISGIFKGRQIQFTEQRHVRLA